jgi:GNAT superfamily N-acetyltransferase
MVLNRYKFFLPSADRHRLRVSQILILPPYQRKGHGQRLLELVYKLALDVHCVEVTIEDPSPAFQFVRDLTDIALCRKHGFFLKKSTLKPNSFLPSLLSLLFIIINDILTMNERMD